MTTPAMVETLQLAKEVHVELDRLREVERLFKVFLSNCDGIVAHSGQYDVREDLEWALAEIRKEGA